MFFINRVHHLLKKRIIIWNTLCLAIESEEMINTHLDLQFTFQESWFQDGLATKTIYKIILHVSLQVGPLFWAFAEQVYT